MPGLQLPRNRAPAEVDNIPDDMARDVKSWAREWSSIERAYADFKRTVQAYVQATRSLNQAAGQKQRDRNLNEAQKKALVELVSRTAATYDALDKLV